MMLRRLIASAVFAIVVAGIVAGCSSNNDTSGPEGSLAIALAVTDAPGAVIKLAGIEARRTDRTWVPIETGLPAEVDLTAITNTGTVATLPADLLPEGDYDALALRVSEAQVTLQGETKTSITPPAGGWTAQIPVSFSIVAGRSTVVNLELHGGSSFVRIDGQYEFDPEIEAESVEHDR